MDDSQSIRKLSELEKEEVATFLESFDTVLTDCDGVLWLNCTPLPGSKDVINKLKDLGKKVFFVSNNSTLTLDQYLKKFSILDYKVQEEDIITPPVVIAAYLNAQGFKKKAYILGCKAFKQTMKAAGIQSIEADTELVEESISGFIEHLENLDSDVGAVIVDYDPKVNYLKLMQAITMLKQKNCIFIVGATDHHVPLTRDITLIGPGYFVTILESATRRKAIEAGKPSPIVAEVISQRHPIIPERTLMIGDSVSQDILLGTNCGFQTLLVLSGISKLQDATQDPKNQPQYYIKTLGDLLPLLQ